jgi:hypothetical protein
VTDDRPTCGYCRDCRWWEPSNEFRRIGVCLRVLDENSHAQLGSELNNLLGPNELLTWPDFGCVQFEPKEGNDVAVAP